MTTASFSTDALGMPSLKPTDVLGQLFPGGSALAVVPSL
jgi:hypothetical protein